jgi:hypothetical protein
MLDDAERLSHFSRILFIVASSNVSIPAAGDHLLASSIR